MKKKYWLDRFLLQPGDIKWLKVFYKIITWIFTAGITLSVLGLIAGVFEMITDTFNAGLQTFATAFGFGILIVIIYLFGMLLCNLLYNIQISRFNSERTVELLEEIAKSNKLKKQIVDEDDTEAK